jgi:hypothetical protein
LNSAFWTKNDKKYCAPYVQPGSVRFTPNPKPTGARLFSSSNALPLVNPLSFAPRFNAPTWQLRLKREDIIVFTVNCADFFENITNIGNLIVSLRRLQCISEQPNQTDILVTANFFPRQIYHALNLKTTALPTILHLMILLCE